jgi:hypothetical protein
MTPRTDQDHTRDVNGRQAPATTPSRETIKQDRAALLQDHDADEVDEDASAHAPTEVDADVAKNYEEAIERGAAQRGEGKPGL